MSTRHPLSVVFYSCEIIFKLSLAAELEAVPVTIVVELDEEFDDVSCGSKYLHDIPLKLN